MNPLVALWFVWAIFVAAAWRFALGRWVIDWRNVWAVPAIYGLMIGLGILGLVVSEALGFRLYGYNPDNPRQYAAYVVLVYSPIGLPIIVGLPIVLIADTLRLLMKRKEKSPE